MGILAKKRVVLMYVNGTQDAIQLFDLQLGPIAAGGNYTTEEVTGLAGQEVDFMYYVSDIVMGGGIAPAYRLLALESVDFRDAPGLFVQSAFSSQHTGIVVTALRGFKSRHGRRALRLSNEAANTMTCRLRVTLLS